jgi:hypothetical protein
MKAKTLLLGQLCVISALACCCNLGNFNRADIPQAKAPADPQPTAEEKRTPTEKDKPKPPIDKEKTYIVYPNSIAKAGINRIELSGPPAQKELRDGYQFVDLAGVQGTPPPKGPYFLQAHTTRHGGGDSSGASPSRGPFFVKQFPAGTNLHKVKIIGSFQAKVHGNHGVGFGIKTLETGAGYTLVEATLE